MSIYKKILRKFEQLSEGGIQYTCTHVHWHIADLMEEAGFQYCCSRPTHEYGKLFGFVGRRASLCLEVLCPWPSESEDYVKYRIRIREIRMMMLAMAHTLLKDQPLAYVWIGRCGLIKFWAYDRQTLRGHGCKQIRRMVLGEISGNS